MRIDLVLTVTGPDRVGIVDEVTEALLDLDGNVETSRMARLGGEFAILMLVSLPDGSASRLEAAFAPLTAKGYTLAHTPTTREAAAAHRGWPAFRIEVVGADHEGIIHEIAHGLSSQGIQVESAETTTYPAAVSGAPLFSMRTVVLVPPALDETAWRVALSEAARQANVDVRVSLMP